MARTPQYGVDSVIIAATDAATAALTGNFDCQEGHYATVRVLFGVEKNTNATDVAIQLSESDDTVVTNFATFDADFNRNVDNTTASVATSHVDLRGRKRYIRLTVTPDTTTNGDIEIGAIGTLYKPVRSGTASDYGDDVIIG